jgi:hypothetical protein
MAGHYGKGYPARLKGVKTGRSVAAMDALQAFHDLLSRVPDAAGLRKDPLGMAPCSCSENSGRRVIWTRFACTGASRTFIPDVRLYAGTSAPRSQAATTTVDTMRMCVAHDTPSEG